MPPVLVSGHHKRVEEWRRREFYQANSERRPDLLEGATLTAEEKKWLAELQQERDAQGEDAE